MNGLKWWFGLTPMEKHRAKHARIKAIGELRLAMARRDTRSQHERGKEAIHATCEALRLGA